MQELFRRVRPLGLTRNYVRRVALPEWWDDDLAHTSSGLAEAYLYVAKHLGLDLKSLQVAGEIRPADVQVKYKKMGNTEPGELSTSRSIALAAARLAVAASPATTGNEEVPAAQTIRRAILEGENLWVTLESLLDYCWSISLPVLHVSDFPAKVKKMHGLATMLKSRPAIVLSHNSQYSAWHLFILAHELGHLHLGHVAEGESLIDNDMNNPSEDDEEHEANRYALELITGDPDIQIHAGGNWPNARDLAEQAQDWGQQHGADPGHVVLNYAHNMRGNFWPVAHAALKLIEPHANAPALINRIMVDRIDWSQLPEESSRFLVEVTNADQHLDAAAR